MKRFSSNTPLACSKIFNQVGRVKAGNANCNNNSILISSYNHFISNNYNTDLLSSQETTTATKPMIKPRIKYLHKDYRRFSTSIQDPTYHPIHSKKTNEKVNGYSSSVITPVPNSNTDTAPANKLLARGYCIGKGDADYEDADDKLYGGEDAYFIQDNTILLGDLTNSLYSKHLSSSNPLKKSNNDPSAPTINDSNTNNIKPIQCIGVADGVGGWRNILGIDASLMARQMMQNCYFYSFHSELIKHPLQLMQLAYNEIIEKKQVTAGSTTCCLLMISEENPNILLSANLGDSGFLVLRNKNVVNGDNNYQIVYRSIPQQHYHNAPYQLAVVPHYLTNKFQDEPTDAMCDAIPIENDDIIILATDGLFDNLYDQQIVDLVNQNINQMDEYQLSKLIAVKARRVGFGTDFVTSTPFQDASEKEGIFYLGGKPDDITVIVSRVVR